MSATPRTHNTDGTRARGTSNGNQRGGSDARRARKAWLLETYASDVKLLRVDWGHGEGHVSYEEPDGTRLFIMLDVQEVPTARCYRCGTLLHMGTITVDRIIPGALGGRYVRNNIRPACGGCNSSTGATVRRKR